MLTFEQKLSIITSFPELQRKDVSLGRVNFHFDHSVHDKKNVVYHLHPNGNGYVFAGLVDDVAVDDKGLVNIRDYTADELRQLIEQSISSLAIAPPEQISSSSESKRSKNRPPQEERWIGPNNAVLTLLFEEDLWYLYSGLHLESAFETYEEAEQYLQDEQFQRDQTSNL